MKDAKTLRAEKKALRAEMKFQAEANAPDMLKTLKRIRDEAKKNKPNIEKIFWLSADAIAKAEGREI